MQCRAIVWSEKTAQEQDYATFLSPLPLWGILWTVPCEDTVHHSMYFHAFAYESWRAPCTSQFRSSSTEGQLLKMFLNTSHEFLIQVLSLIRTCSHVSLHPCTKRQNVSFKYYGNITSDKDAQNATGCRVHLHLFHLCWDAWIVLLLPFIWLGKFLYIHANSQASASVRFMM